MRVINPVLKSAVCLIAGAFLAGCASPGGTPPPRKWPASTPGSYPGNTAATRNGEWWFPSEIGPMEVPDQGGNRGTIFYLAGGSETVQRTVYKARYVDKKVRVERIIFPEITFDVNSDALDADAREQVAQAAAAIKQAKGHRVIIEGHNDAGETSGIDKERAMAVSRALANLGIAKQRRTVEPMGDSRPLSRADTPLGHELNRRVSFTFIPEGLNLNPQPPADEPLPAVAENVRVVDVVKRVTIERPKLVYVDRIVFPNILFDYDKANIRADAEPRVARASEVARSLSSLNRLTVVGHCDSRGSDSYNETLSIRRANTVHDRLISDGLGGSRVSADGRGERQPIATNDTASGRQLNRRVEFEVTYRD